MKSKRHSADYYLLFAIFTLLGIGILMVFSATAMENVKDPYYYLKRQVLFSIVGLGVLVWTMNLDYRRLKRYSWYAFPVATFFLLLVLGTAGVKGSKSWLPLGSFGFQPSELVKPAIALMLAKILSAKGDKVSKLEGLAPALLVIGFFCGLIMLQPDLGTTMVIAVSSMIILMIGGASFLHLGILSSLGGAAVLFYALTNRVRYLRIFGFLNREHDPLGINFQLTQSLFAVGSGGLLGVGLGQSHQKLGYLPEHHNDFIFAIIAEELGFVGAFFVMALFAILVYRGYKVAKETQDPFGSLLAAGITTFIMIEAMMNIAVVIGAMPVTGITLPLISYGGSSLLFKLFGLGMLLSVSRYTKPQVQVTVSKEMVGMN